MGSTSSREERSSEVEGPADLEQRHPGPPIGGWKRNPTDDRVLDTGAGAENGRDFEATTDFLGISEISPLTKS